MSVVVVTSVELGWDCIVAVFNEGDYPQEDLEKVFPRKNGYVIFHRDINSLDEFQDEEGWEDDEDDEDDEEESEGDDEGS